MLNWQIKNHWAPRAAAAAAAAPAAPTAPADAPAAPVSPAAPADAPAALAGPTPVPAVHIAVPAPAIKERRFQQWLLEQDMVEFWAWVGHSDNATHFKSGKMFHYWSNLSRDVEFIKMVWVNFGCPGHGKGPWDGFGAVVKTKVCYNVCPPSDTANGDFGGGRDARPSNGPSVTKLLCLE